jgi:site-specific recombinase XerD
MTHLRKMMLEELQRRNYSENTIRCYIRTVEDFARRFKCPPDRLGPQHIRQYQAELFQKRKLSSGTVVIHLAALRFFYTKTLRRHWSIADTPYPKKTHRLPTILSQEEVAQLIDAASTPFHLTVDSVSREISNSSLSQRPSPPGYDLCSDKTGWCT